MSLVPISFVGAGPGDPELITVKGQRLLRDADVIVYAGSLVNPALLSLASAECEIFNSASMTLNEVLDVMISRAKECKAVVRLHTGDPSIYGAIQEQINALDEQKIPWTIIPGVSSFLAAAAALGQEYTLPEVSQSVIITRLQGRTPVPELEKLSLLASHQATMCIFLSVQMVDEVVRELLAGGYSEDTPVAVVEKASWPDERIVRCNLKDLAAKVAEAQIDRTAMIVVGSVLNKQFQLSKLYSPEFGHMFREATQ